MKILVFGKDGQLGKAFREELEVRTSSLLAKPLIQYVGRSECDLTNTVALEQLLNQFQPQLIINASAYTAVDKAEVESDLAFAINARAPEIMAQYAADHSATFLHYSTDYVFDGEKYGYYLEDDLRNPLGVYGKSKAAGEEGIARVFDTVGGDGQYAIFRTSWVYGDGGNFIRTILRLAKEREELKIIDDQYGVPTSAAWLAQVSLNLVADEGLNIKEFPSGIYHAVPAGETTWHGLATLVVQSAFEAGVTMKAARDAIKPIPSVEYPLPAPRPMNSRMSTDKLRKVFEARGDMSKLQQLNHSWSESVKTYISNLAKDGLI
ncbi:MAG: dTDP-4-dehydrorhamnose reductase [Polynucleobacter sp. 24-46-87]|uniref:dTDP-4-dehydrorhamnose reductase n=1 Tax=unclassified Polynucleobacter TaxID=2640945 RepID=UPI000BC5CBDB|nr:MULTISPECIES: dTDP-4-dehydrorhamnose reductase [unclassified Polynucleobacter]OYY18082.1 MAG: dTDP-4-dehydrorhamnose reductase [Polynucleobacter sp. 35-46-11]OZA15264.1 MAG: dTDP-4-dehydrorhamnose reductase [Polynucleobacter sp. 24-46-87]OZA76270.1 MAG: dTDP-4-dehydrorhamnose reductase [Polynucleobacter sp. 39-46-10]